MKTGVTLKEGYMGGYAYTGDNYRGYMPYAEINKIVKKEFKNEFKDVKVSCRGNGYSGGQSVYGLITMKLEDGVVSLDEFKKAIKDYYEEKGYCFQVHHYLGWWDYNDNNTYDELVEILYNKYLGLLKSEMRVNRVDEVLELLLKSKLKDAIKYLNALYDSFNDVDINGMVDYFDVMFYKDVSVKLVEE